MIDVVLPVLDEAEAIPWVLGRMPPGYRPIVVDNGSVDDSASIARSMGASVVEEPHRGFGAACWAGLTHASSEIVCFMDCDGSLDPADLSLVTRPVATGEADLVLGARTAARGAWPPHARVANRVLAHRLRRRGIMLKDVGPMRAARRTALLDLGIMDRTSGWPLEMVLRASGAGWRVIDTPVPYRPRTGRSKVTGTARGTVHAVRSMSYWLRTLD
jgi:glycosyltransferase involved in cell wall biosynthesis